MDVIKILEYFYPSTDLDQKQRSFSPSSSSPSIARSTPAHPNPSTGTSSSSACPAVHPLLSSLVLASALNSDYHSHPVDQHQPDYAHSNQSSSSFYSCPPNLSIPISASLLPATLPLRADSTHSTISAALPPAPLRPTATHAPTRSPASITTPPSSPPLALLVDPPGHLPPSRSGLLIPHTPPLTNTSILSSSTNASTSQKTHKKNLSDCPSSESNHPSSSAGRPPTPTLTQLEIPSLIAHTRTRRENQEPSGSRSIVTSLGLAPISQSFNHPFSFNPHHPPTNPTALHDFPSYNATSTDALRFVSQGSSIPSLLNPSRLKPVANDPSQTDHQTQAEGIHTNQQTKDPNPLLQETPLSSPKIANHPFQTRATFLSVPNRHADLNAYSRQHQDPHPRSTTPDTSQSPPPPPLKPNVTGSQPRQTLRRGVSFEPSGKSFCKYALPKPRLDANPASQESTRQRKGGHNRQNSTTVNNPTVVFPSKTPVIESDTNTEELKERFWNSKPNNLTANQVWAEIYISRLERKLWKAQAEADISADCLAFCIPSGSNGGIQKPQNSRRRRVASASDAVQARPGASPSRPKKLSQSKEGTNKSKRFDLTAFYKASGNEQTCNQLIRCQRSSPLEISDGPLRHLPCISSSNYQPIDVIIPYRPDLLSSPRHQPQSNFRPATNPRVIRREASTNFPRSNDSERGYRIVLPVANSQQPKSQRRRSRSVPELRQIHVQLPSPPQSMKDMTGISDDLTYKHPEFYIDRPWPVEDPTSPTTLSIPQTLLDAMFPPAPDSARNTPPYPSENVLSLGSSSRPVHCVSSTKDLHRSVCATIEVPDGTVAFSRSDSADASNELSESISKGPLYSLPRFIEPRPTAVVALPPPPRKRNPTPAVSTHSSSQNSSVRTKRSTNESMVAHLSYPTPSEKSGLEFPVPPSIRLSRRSSSPLTPPNPRTDQVVTSPIQPTSFVYETSQRIQRRSISSIYPISPTCQSPDDSAHRYSGFLSHVSSRPCSLGVTSPWIDREGRDDRITTFTPSKPPLSALYLTSSPQIHLAGDDEPNTVVNSMSAFRDSTHSGGSASSHSAIDPDKPINQADLFYQVPASPRRSLIRDYDDHMKQTTENQVGASTSTAVIERSVLIDEILAGYAGPRRTLMTRPVRPRLKTQELVTESALDLAKDQDEAGSTQSAPVANDVDSSQSGTRSAVTQRIPRIIDAFEARLSSHSRYSSH
ncbi:uncharacterized protein PGTG_02425 [Puccinia graminis f. sp. tritici CRL 75-36-700-3]|uniref:Uncharacterized protein n=1 Tax=Puccinia graminis f. sp. tritici (strain CRL 75-36-700-3 / race SCCL) TaxID=418459 RepID=E3JY39_PUCGT|nr:uncharacterized protein PGTG_02425 [Puccinia graminis f. sp. tritici CRL 75-36-700-3]EFP76964.1 hypothetical protein PGTG_02425 [Puccinia graminis f. sp. tritici CRL 75-36-700-3]